MARWDTTVDCVIVGSGGGGMVAALAATDAGASALVPQSQVMTSFAPARCAAETPAAVRW